MPPQLTMSLAHQQHQRHQRMQKDDAASTITVSTPTANASKKEETEEEKRSVSSSNDVMNHLSGMIGFCITKNTTTANVDEEDHDAGASTRTPPISPLSNGFPHDDDDEDNEVDVGADRNNVDVRSPVAQPPSSSSAGATSGRVASPSRQDIRDDSRVCSPVMLTPSPNEGMVAKSHAGDYDEESKTLPLPATVGAAPNGIGTKTTTTPHKHLEKRTNERQKQQQEGRQEQKQPFFVFDWLDELVPKDHNAELLAELLQTPEKQKPPARRPVATGTNNANVQQQQDQLSPVLQFFFSRFHRGGNDGGNNIFVPSKVRATTATCEGPENYYDLQQNTKRQQQRRILSEPSLRLHGRSHEDTNNDDDYASIHSSPSSGQIQTPSTPKSSNKRKSILRRRLYQRQGQQAERQRDQSEGGDGDDEYNFYESPIAALPVPTRLETQLDLVTMDHAAGVPMLDLDSNKTDDETLKLRHRNHLLRRQRRQKNPCIVRRSLELAQAWNLKGLQKAREASAEDGPARSWEDALAAWNNALEIITALLGKRHVQYAMIQNNRGIALGRLELYDEAFEALNVALEIRQSRLVPTVRATSADSHNDRSTRRKEHCRYPGDENVDGDIKGRINTNNTSTLEEVVSTLHNLANVYQAKGDLSTALSVLGYSRGLCVEAIGGGIGDSSGQTQVASNSACALHSARLCVAMGHVYWEASQFDDARDAYQDAMQLYEQLAVEATRLNVNMRNDSGSCDLRTMEESQQYEVVAAELVSLRVDLEELEGLREQQWCNYQEQLLLERQLEGGHQGYSMKGSYPAQNCSQYQYEQYPRRSGVHW